MVSSYISVTVFCISLFETWYGIVADEVISRLSDVHPDNVSDGSGVLPTSNGDSLPAYATDPTESSPACIILLWELMNKKLITYWTAASSQLQLRVTQNDWVMRSTSAISCYHTPKVRLGAWKLNRFKDRNNNESLVILAAWLTSLSQHDRA